MSFCRLRPRRRLLPRRTQTVQPVSDRRTSWSGRTPQFEQDLITLSSGIRFGLSQGGPIAIRIANTEWPKWETVMSAGPVEAADLSGARGAPLTRPRPGHADFTGMQKYGFEEARPVLERASARETATRVALGAVAQRFLSELGINLVTHTVAIGPVIGLSEVLPGPTDQLMDKRWTWCMNRCTVGWTRLYLFHITLTPSQSICSIWADISKIISEGGYHAESKEKCTSLLPSVSL